MSDPREESQGDRARLNARVERLEDSHGQLGDRVAEDHDEVIRLRSDLDALKEKLGEVETSREKGGDRMWTIGLMVAAALLNGIGALATLLRKG